MPVMELDIDVEGIACQLMSQMPLEDEEACEQIMREMTTIVPQLCKARAARQRDPPTDA